MGLSGQSRGAKHTPGPGVHRSPHVVSGPREDQSHSLKARVQSSAVGEVMHLST